VFDLDSPEQGLLESMEEHHVDVSLVQPYPGADSVRDVHDRIAALARDNPGRFFGIASINPHQDRQAYFDELSRCVKELGFVAVKLHTIGHALNPAGADALTVFESASQLGIPVMVHTGPGIPFAAPSALAPRLKSFPQVPLVMAHAGHGIFSGEAIAMAQAFPQVTLEPSWCTFYHIGAMVDALGANRVMFGTDLPPNVPVMLQSIRALGLGKEDEAMIMGGTAKAVFKLNI
jgi:predicted TIM-barrel fold metal-dependent hydrolase